MNARLNSLLITAVGLTLSAAAAYGQNKVAADIPFSFRTAGGMQEAGRYAAIPANLDGSVLRIQNLDTGKSVLLGIGIPDGDYNKRPRLVFRCGDKNGCVLAGVWMADGRGWSYNTPKMKAADRERVAVIYFNNNQAE
ncbi:MAG TPA: hypothetical protein VH639_29160 [Bryobacteraceae bacterium]